MSRIRSPAHPDTSLSKAVELAAKLFERIRSNPVDRDTAVKEMGYSGMTGASGKMLSNLIHFGLVEKAGKGAVKITPLTVQIAHPKSPDVRRAALHQAGWSPEFFQSIRKEFTDGIPSETWLRSFMMREGFNSEAIGPAMSSYLDTCRFLQQENAYESHGAPAPAPVVSAEIDDFDGTEDMEAHVDDERHGGAVPPLRRQQQVEKPGIGNDQGSAPGWQEERLIDDGGEEIFIRYKGDASLQRYEYIRDYLDFKIKRMKRE